MTNQSCHLTRSQSISHTCPSQALYVNPTVICLIKGSDIYRRGKAAGTPPETETETELEALTDSEV